MQPLLLTKIKARVAIKVAYSSSEGDFQGLELRPVEIKGGNLQDVKQAHVCRKGHRAVFTGVTLKALSSNNNVREIELKLF